MLCSENCLLCFKNMLLCLQIWATVDTRSFRYKLKPNLHAEHFWHNSDEKSMRTKKISSAQIDLVV